jgi:hypothetical protein
MTEIQRVAPKMLPAEIRNYLASFLFTGDSAFQRWKRFRAASAGVWRWQNWH